MYREAPSTAKPHHRDETTQQKAIGAVIQRARVSRRLLQPLDDGSEVVRREMLRSKLVWVQAHRAILFISTYARSSGDRPRSRQRAQEFATSLLCGCEGR